MNLNHPAVKQIAQVMADCLGCQFSEILQMIDDQQCTEQIIQFGQIFDRAVLFFKLNGDRLVLAHTSDILYKGEYFGYIFKRNGSFIYGNFVFDYEVLRSAVVDEQQIAYTASLEPVLQLFDYIEYFGKVSFVGTPYQIMSDQNYARVFSEASGPHEELTYWVTRLAVLQKLTKLARDTDYQLIYRYTSLCHANIKYIRQIVLLFTELQNSSLEILEKKLRIQFKQIEELFNLGTFYRISENMQSLLLGIVNYIIIIIKARIASEAKNIFDIEIKRFKEIFDYVKHINYVSQSIFKEIKHKYAIDVSETSVFNYFDIFEETLRKVFYVSCSHADMAYLSKTTINELSGLDVRVYAFFEKIKAADPFGESAFDALFATYYIDVYYAELSIEEYLHASDSYSLTKYINVVSYLMPVLNRERFHETVRLKYKHMLNLFYYELKQTKASLDYRNVSEGAEQFIEVAEIRKLKFLISRIEERFDYFRRVFSFAAFQNDFEREQVVGYLLAQFGSYYYALINEMPKNQLPILFTFYQGSKVVALFYYLQSTIYNRVQQKYNSICYQAGKLRVALGQPLLERRNDMLECNYSNEIIRQYRDAFQLREMGFSLPRHLEELVAMFYDLSKAHDMLCDFCYYYRHLRIQVQFRGVMRPIMTRIQSKIKQCAEQTNWNSLNLINYCYQLHDILAEISDVNKQLEGIDAYVKLLQRHILDIDFIDYKYAREFRYAPDMSKYDASLLQRLEFVDYFSHYLMELSVPTFAYFLEYGKSSIEAATSAVVRAYLAIVRCVLVSAELVLSHYFSDKQSQTAELVDTAYLLGVLNYFAPRNDITERLSQLPRNALLITEYLTYLFDFYRDSTYECIVRLFIKAGKQLCRYFAFYLDYYVMGYIAADVQHTAGVVSVTAPLFYIDVVYGVAGPRITPDVNSIDSGFGNLINLMVTSAQRIPLWTADCEVRNSILQFVSRLSRVKSDSDQLLLSSRVVYDESAGKMQRNGLFSFVDAAVSSDRSLLATKSARSARDMRVVDAALFKDLAYINVAYSVFSLMSKNVSILTSMMAVRGRITQFSRRLPDILAVLLPYSIYWDDNRNQRASDFLRAQPTSAEFVAKIQQIGMAIDAAGRLPEMTRQTAFMICYGDVKAQLVSEIKQDLYLYCQSYNLRARIGLKYILGDLAGIEKVFKLSIDYHQLDNVYAVMQSIYTLKDMASVFEQRIQPIHDMYEFLYQQYYNVPEHEIEQEDYLRYKAQYLESQALKIEQFLLEQYYPLYLYLLQQINRFSSDVAHFVADYQSGGPYLEGILPKDAALRLELFYQKTTAIDYMYAQYRASEQLFGLQEHQYEAYFIIKREIDSLHKLYSLYNDVTNTIQAYHEYLWQECDFLAMYQALQELQNRCSRMPKQLRGIAAYTELKAKLDVFIDIYPVLYYLSHKAIIDRHWREIAYITGAQRVLWVIENPETFKLGYLLYADIAKHRDEIEDLALAATKESDIEDKLNAVVALWGEQKFVLLEYKQKGMAILDVKKVSELNLLIEDSLMTLSSLFSNRFNKPFKADIYKQLHIVSTIDECTKLWIYVYQSWIYLEAVFASGDISRQLPYEARRFIQIEKQWLRLMSHAFGNSNCVFLCTMDDVLAQTLQPLLAYLEETYRCLSGYLEQKRDIFPRFAFISDNCLLELLGGQSDCNTIYQFAPQLFDSLYRVVFDTGRNVTAVAIQDKVGETIELLYPVYVSGNIEDWLQQLIIQMQRAVRQLIKAPVVDMYQYAYNLEMLMESYPSQACLVFLYIYWTFSCEAYFRGKCERLEQKRCYQSIAKILEQLINMTKHYLSAAYRTNIETLITIQVHQKDIFQQLSAGDYMVRSVADFEWLKQTRVYWNAESNECIVKITDVEFKYQYEYLGISERLVITPLTDRCYITLAQALGMFLGGSPKGPAGTGKTETCKDFGKTMGYYVVVFNCSDQMDYKGLGRIFKGIAQSGIYGDFDEFNRVELAVMSVAAQQIQCVLQCLKYKSKTAEYTDGSVLKVRDTCAYFITMNPGYAGRVELLENLKILFRSVSMMIPDKQIIMDVKLAASGFYESRELSKKFYILYQLCVEQLSQQRHYDFGLRNVLSVLRTCGFQRRYYPELSEAFIVLRVLRDMNRSKLVAYDVPLFEFLLRDLFPGIEAPDNKYEQLEAQIRVQAYQLNYYPHVEWVKSVIYFYESFAVRHSVMLLGETNSGKSAIIGVLSKSLSYINNTKYQICRLNPKSITAAQMFGSLSSAGDWTDGVFAAIWRRAAHSYHFQMLVLDGPVDAVWIENLNTVMDDNKMLTLANSDRISMTNNMKLIIEVDSLDNASPATVSRAGMIYLNGYRTMGWVPFYESYCGQWGLKIDMIPALEEAYSYALACECQFVMQPLQYIRYFIYLFLAVALENPYQYVARARQWMLEGFVSARDAVLRALSEAFIVVQKEIAPDTILKYLFFALVYAFASLMTHAQKVEFCSKIEHSSKFDAFPKPPKAAYFDYFIDRNGEWCVWESRYVDYAFDGDYEKALVPNKDNTYLRFLAEKLLNLTNVLVVGEAGSGKTKIIRYLQREQAFKLVSMSSTVTSDMLLANLQSFFVKRLGTTYGPPLSRFGTIFFDDISTPCYNEWGDQPTNEFVRYMLEQFYFYSLTNPGETRQLEDVQYVAAMQVPGCGRNDIPSRLKSQFFTIFMNLPEDAQIDAIYTVFYSYHFNTHYATEVSQLALKLPKCLRYIVFSAKTKILPTPEKFFYRFSLREMSRVTFSLMQLESSVAREPSDLLRCFLHECMREISDRFIEDADTRTFKAIVSQACKAEFGEYGERVFASLDNSTHYCNFLRNQADTTGENGDSEQTAIYELATSDYIAMRVQLYIKDFNERYKKQQMDLVLFHQCVQHIARLSRVLHAFGNMLLVGVGGSGKYSIVKLVAYIMYSKLFSISITKSYNLQNFDDDMKRLCTDCIYGPILFQFADSDLKIELFMDRINNLLMLGEIPALFNKEEAEAIVYELRPYFKKECPRKADTNENLWVHFLLKIKQNMRIVLCFSPGAKLRELANKYPGIVNGCTVDFYDEWAYDALEYVARHVLQIDERVCCCLAQAHHSVQQITVDYKKRRNRYTAVTPKSFFNLLACFKALLANKQTTTDAKLNELKYGLLILQNAANDIARMKLELEAQKIELNNAIQQAEQMMKDIHSKSYEAKIVYDEVQAVADACYRYAEQIEREKAVAEAGLQKAMPLLIKAEQALNSIEPSKIQTLRSLRNPPNLIYRILDSVLILLNVKMDKVQMDVQREKLRANVPSWQISYQVMAKDFLNRLYQYDRDSITDEQCELLDCYISQADFLFENSYKASKDVCGLFNWVVSMKQYHFVALEVEPKRRQVREMELKYKAALYKLQTAQYELAAKQQKLQELYYQLLYVYAHKDALYAQTELTQRRLQTAHSLISGLSGERTRWAQQLTEMELLRAKVVGDTILLALFLSYSSPYEHDYRLTLLKHWEETLQRNQIAYYPAICGRLAYEIVDENYIGQWKLLGLPNDEVSLQNAVVATNTHNFVLIIDPQNQANYWLKRMFERTIVVTQQNKDNFRHVVENALENGQILLVEDIEEDIDPLLEPLLRQQFYVTGNSKEVRVGDAMKLVDPQFKLFFTTRLAAPQYPPELFAKCQIIDFTVSFEGLEQYFLSHVVNIEKNDLEMQRIQLLREVNANQKLARELEARLLTKLSSATDNLLDDTDLIEVLNNTKATALEVQQKLKNARETEAQIDEARAEYQNIACRGALFYFLITDLARVNHMYQTSLSYYVEVFKQSVSKAETSQNPIKRIYNVLQALTRNSYNYIVRGLFAIDKKSFTLKLALQIEQRLGRISGEQMRLFLHGGQQTDTLLGKPDWMSDYSWQNICALRRIPRFGDIAVYCQELESFRALYFCDLSQAYLPDEYSSVSAFEKLLLFRCLREDAVVEESKSYIAHVLGAYYNNQENYDLDQLMSDEAGPLKPVCFLLTQSSDPTSVVQYCASHMRVDCVVVSMGQGQEQIARNAILHAMQVGGIVQINNSHLAVEFMAEVDEALGSVSDGVDAQRQTAVATEPYLKTSVSANQKCTTLSVAIAGRSPHMLFRLVLATEQNARFPIPLLQRSIKLTNEAPAGVQNGLYRLFAQTQYDFLDSVESPRFIQLIYNLSVLHVLASERKKFGPIGWSGSYEFGTHDFNASAQFIQYYFYSLDTKRNSSISWKTINYMIAEIYYGGEITDDWDRRAMAALVHQFFNAAAITEDRLPNGFQYQKKADINSIFTTIAQIKNADSSQSFLLAESAYLAYREQLAAYLLNYLSLGRIAAAGRAVDVAECIYHVPETFELKCPRSTDPLDVFLYQEVQRYNKAVRVVSSVLYELKLALEGRAVMSDTLTTTYSAIQSNTVPERFARVAFKEYHFTYFLYNLKLRYAYYKRMASAKQNVYQIACFYNPRGFLTAVRQRIARAHGWPLDSVHTSTQLVKRLQSPEDIALDNLRLFYAAYDMKRESLTDVQPGFLFADLPLLILAASQEEPPAHGYYECPVYSSVARTQEHYIFSVRIKSDAKANTWAIKGVAIVAGAGQM